MAEYAWENLIGIIAIVVAVGLPVVLGGAIALTWIRSKHEEDMGLIKQGIVPVKDTTPQKPMLNRYRALRNGFLFTGAGLGIIVWAILIIAHVLTEDVTRFFTFPALVFLFVGLAFILFYRVVKDKNINE
jgi:hypothetical protein